ncbi:MAG: transposase zinc-binding domain-containing protein [Pirellulaceae bacterium]|nr:transposase zinc-binding domain-containing protein [Pirellulaceae bacterium]
MNGGPGCPASARRWSTCTCGDRHCPTCSGARRAEWVDGHARLLLDGVHYFQVVFTLPVELSSLALGNRRASYLDRCARLLDAADVPLSDEADQFEPQNWESREEDPCRCPSCGDKLQLVLMETRRSWRDILYSPVAPIWYRLRNPLRPPDPGG